MISIHFNDEIIEIEPNCSLANILEAKGYQDPGFAVALNRHFIPRKQHVNTILNSNDIIEIIVPMQGG